MLINKYLTLISLVLRGIFGEKKNLAGRNKDECIIRWRSINIVPFNF